MEYAVIQERDFRSERFRIFFGIQFAGLHDLSLYRVKILFVLREHIQESSDFVSMPAPTFREPINRCEQLASAQRYFFASSRCGFRIFIFCQESEIEFCFASCERPLEPMRIFQDIATDWKPSSAQFDRPLRPVLRLMSSFFSAGLLCSRLAAGPFFFFCT